jgi:hypothetical protein
MLSLETQQSQSGSFRTKVAVAVAATAAIGVVAAVTLSSSSAERKQTGLFNIPEDIKGHFSGGQLTGEWTVQGKFHKFELASGDWQIDSKLTVEGPTMGGAETYTLVDNVLVVEPDFEHFPNANLTCGDRQNMPGYAKWTDLLEKAEAVSMADMGPRTRSMAEANCPAGSTSVVIRVEDVPYVICGDSTANTRAMYAFNGKFSFSAISREGMTVDIAHPKGWEALNCTTFDTSITRQEAFNRIGEIYDDRELQRGERGPGREESGGRGEEEEWIESEAKQDEFQESGDRVSFDARGVERFKGDDRGVFAEMELMFGKVNGRVNKEDMGQQTNFVGNVAHSDEAKREGAVGSSHNVFHIGTQRLSKGGNKGGGALPFSGVAPGSRSGAAIGGGAIGSHSGALGSTSTTTTFSGLGGGGGGSAYTTTTTWVPPTAQPTLSPTSTNAPTASPTYPGGWTSPGNRNCAFFHGVGGPGSPGMGLRHTFDHYWGTDRFGQYCGNYYKYLNTNSRYQGYNTPAYMDEICLTLTTNNTPHHGATDFPNQGAQAVIFTHSMGGLTTRRAFADGRCAWSGKYYMSQAPMYGSKGANFASVVCALMSASMLSWIISIIILAAYCRPYGVLAHYGYTTIYHNVPWYPSNPGSARATGRLCGTNPMGFSGGTGVGLTLIQHVSGLQRRNDWCVIPRLQCGWRGCRSVGCWVWMTCPKNDGMVDYNACSTDNAHTLSSTNIRTMGINHSNGSGRDGDRSGGAQVDNWFISRI